jgi:hypothetical protein
LSAGSGIPLIESAYNKYKKKEGEVMKTGKKITMAAFSALLFSAAVANAVDLYLDLNGPTAGFGVDSTASPIDVNFTNLTWNTDSTGGAGGAITNVNDGDILHFGLEGTAGILFNWSYYTNKTVGGIHTYQTAGSTAGINRFQKAGGGFQTINWAPGATFNTEKSCGLFWDLGTFGDFEKVGDQWLTFDDGGVKVNGTCTISTNNVIVRNLGTVSSVSSFKLNGGQLRFKGGLSGTANIGTLSGSGKVDRDSTGTLTALTLNTKGFDMVNGSASDTIYFDRGPDVVLTSDSTTSIEINKSGGTNYSDYVKTWWPDSDFTFDGTLDVTLLGGSETLAAGDTFKVVEKNASANFFGSFSSNSLPDLGDPGLIWSTSLLASSGTISVVVADTNAPSAPTGLIAVSNVYTVSLDWDDNPEATVTGYKVYRSETGNTNDFVEIADVGSSEYIDTTTIPNDITYYYRVTAYNFVNVESENPSDVASTTVLFGLRNGDFELPAIALNSGTTISNSGDWVQNGDKQGIQHAVWAAESGNQGAWLKGFNQNVTNSFWQDVPAAAGLEYTLDAGIKVGAGFRTNGGQIEMALVWLDAGSMAISSNTLNVISAISTNGAFAHTNITATAPVGTAMVRSEFYWTTTVSATNNGTGDKSCLIDNVSITRSSAPSAYDIWEASFSLVEGADGDDDKDGVSNLYEFGLKGDPTNSADTGIAGFDMTEQGGTNAFKYIHVQRKDGSLDYSLILTENLVFGPWATNSGFTVTSGSYDADFNMVTNTTSTVEAQKFIKLLIEEN